MPPRQAIARPSDFCDPCPHSLPPWVILAELVFFLLLLLGGPCPLPPPNPPLCGRLRDPPPAAGSCWCRTQALLALQPERRLASTGRPGPGGLRELFEETGPARVASPASWGAGNGPGCSPARPWNPLRVPAGTGFVSLLQAPDLGGEILNARLIAAADLPPDQRRFPAQLDWIAPRLAEVPESQVLWVTDFSDAASALHRAGVAADPAPATMARAGCALAGRVICWARPLPAGAAALAAPCSAGPDCHLLFAMVLLTLVVNLLKAGIPWPRPFHLQAQAGPPGARGFGMPSSPPPRPCSTGACCWLAAGTADPGRALLALLLAGVARLAPGGWGPLLLGCGGRRCLGALLALRAPLAGWRHAGSPGQGAGPPAPSRHSPPSPPPWPGLPCSPGAGIPGNLLSTQTAPPPPCPAALLTLAGGLVIAGLLAGWCPRSPAALC